MLYHFGLCTMCFKVWLYTAVHLKKLIFHKKWDFSHFHKFCLHRSCCKQFLYDCKINKWEYIVKTLLHWFMNLFIVWCSCESVLWVVRFLSQSRHNKYCKCEHILWFYVTFYHIFSTTYSALQCALIDGTWVWVSTVFDSFYSFNYRQDVSSCWDQSCWICVPFSLFCFVLIVFICCYLLVSLLFKHAS